jgi:hypothetical protein
MTEAEWLTCTDPYLMLESLDLVAAGDRKLQLFAAACCRRIWPLLPDELCRQGIDVAEGYADGRLDRREVQRMREAVDSAWQVDADRRRKRPGRSRAVPSRSGNAYEAASCLLFWDFTHTKIASHLVGLLVGASAAAAWSDGIGVNEEGAATERAAQADLWREILGNPLRGVSLDPAWRTPLALSIALGAYEERILPEGNLTSDRLAVLADALEDAGCADEAILTHLRSAGPHVRGCWVIDLILGKHPRSPEWSEKLRQIPPPTPSPDPRAPRSAAGTDYAW